MSEIINLEIRADQSGADEALKQVNKSLKEGTEAAEALNHVLDGDLAGTFKSLGELSKTLGIDLGLAFSPAEIIAFAQVVAEVADKLSKLIADTFIYTDAMKEQDKALASANKSLEASAARVKALDRATQLAAAQGIVAKEKLRLAFTLEDLGGDPKVLKKKLEDAEADLRRLQAVMNDTSHPKFGMHNEFGQMQEDIKTLSEVTIPGLQGALAVAGAEVRKTGQEIKNDLADETEKAAKKAEALHTKFVALVNAERQAMADKAAAHETAEAQETQAVMRETEKQNQEIIKAAEEQTKTWDKDYENQIQAAKDASTQKIAQIEQDLARGKINQQQAIILIAQAKENELALEKLAQQARWALWDKDPVKRKEIEGQIARIVSQAQTVETKVVTDGIKAQDKQWKAVITGMQSEFSGFTQGLISGHQTIAQSWDNLVNNMTAKFLEGLERQLLQFIANQVIKDQVEHEENLKNGRRSAIEAAKEAYKWGAGWGGPPAGAISAAVAFTAVEAFGSAEGGQYIVPNNQLTMLHPQEMVLPAGIANQMRSVIGGGGGAGMTVVVNHSVSAVDAASFQGHIRRHSNMIANEVTRALKRKGVR